MISVGRILHDEKTDENKSLLNFIVRNNPHLVLEQVMDLMLVLPVGKGKNHHQREVDSEGGSDS